MARRTWRGASSTGTSIRITPAGTRARCTAVCTCRARRGDGEALRAFTTINNVSAGTAHGVHGSLNFGSTGRVTGLGVAIHGTLHIPDDASWAPGTISALCAEIYSDGDASDTDGATDVSFIRVANSGNANGVADVEDDAALMSFAGFTIGSGNMLAAKSAAAVTHVIRIKVGSTPYYLMVSDQI